jgi:predicted porin
MKKTLIAMAVASLAATPVMADKKSDHNFFGQAKTEVGLVGDLENFSPSFRGTRFGVHGSEDLGNGMKGIYRLMGNVGAGGSTFAFNEELWAGVAGDFGTIRFGRSDTATKLSVLPFRAFTDTIADAQGFNTQRWTRSVGIHYRTKDMNGLVINAEFAPNGNETNADIGLSAVFTSGGLRFSAAFEQIGETVTKGKSAVADKTYDVTGGAGSITIPGSSATADTTNKATTNLSVGVHYKAGALGAGALYQDIDGDTQITLPVTYRVDSVTYRAAVVNTDNGAKATDVALGGILHLSRKTNMFVNIWTTGDMDANNLGLGMQRSF